MFPVPLPVPGLIVGSGLVLVSASLPPSLSAFPIAKSVAQSCIKFYLFLKK